MMRVVPPPDSVTVPPPSITRSPCLSAPATLLITSAAVSVMVAGSGPQANVTTPPFATAAASAASVQLPGVPVPTTVVGCDVSTSLPSAGIAHVTGGRVTGPASGISDASTALPLLPPPHAAP